MKSIRSISRSGAHLKDEEKYFRKRSVNISNHYLKALKGEVERRKDRITATAFHTNAESLVKYSRAKQVCARGWDIM